jgi:hypothetical protein
MDCVTKKSFSKLDQTATHFKSRDALKDFPSMDSMGRHTHISARDSCAFFAEDFLESVVHGEVEPFAGLLFFIGDQLFH